MTDDERRGRALAHARDVREREASWSQSLHGPDTRPEAVALIGALVERREILQGVLGWAELVGDEYTYRFYHQSWDVYAMQGVTGAGVAALRSVMPNRELNAFYLTIVTDGTGLVFEDEHNARWLQVTRPIVEAFSHTVYFLRMAIMSCDTIESPPPRLMPAWWAAMLHLYNL